MILKLICIILTYFVLYNSIDFVQCEDVIVDLPALGRLNGSITEGAWTNKTIYSFLNVKFAESPSGRLRFKAPIPKRPWNGTINVQNYGLECPFITNILNLTPEEMQQDLEDCLHMSIFTGNLSQSARLPVMVYYHGGSFVTGSAIQYPSNYLLEKDIVLVVAQYRLGPLGFLSTMSEQIPGNAAVLDAILALEWIQKYIQFFGGDPTQITIFGQSAGAAMVSALVMIPTLSPLLFHKVIIQSGSAISSWSYDHDPIGHSREMAGLIGCNQTAPIEEINRCFMNVDVLTLLWFFTEHFILGNMIGPEYFGGNKITIGGPTNLFPMTPYQLMRNGIIRSDIPIMAGATKHDGTFALANIYNILTSTVGVDNAHYNSFNMIDTVNQLFGVDDQTGSLTGFFTKKLFTHEQLKNGSFHEMLDGYIDISCVTIMKGPTFRAAQSNAQRNPENTYLYTFDYDGEFTRFGYGADTSHFPFDGGIHHSNEMIYLFPYPEFVAQLNEADTKMAKKMVDLWTSFAITGRPYSDDCIEWPPLTDISGPYMHLNEECTIGADYNEEYSVTVREGMPPPRENTRITQFMRDDNMQKLRKFKLNSFDFKFDINYGN